MALTSKLENIGNAIRNKTGKTDKLTLDEMATEIASITTGEGGGGDIPEEALVISGNCSYKFAYGGWNWFVNEYGDRITTKDITASNYMFYYNDGLTEIPFDINIAKSCKNLSKVFDSCNKLTKAPSIIAKDGLTPPTSSYSGQLDMGDLFAYCRNLREVPYDFFNNFITEEFRDASVSTGGGKRSGMFSNCESLRKLPDLSRIHSGTSSAYDCFYYGGISNCTTLDEVHNYPVMKVTFTSHMFNSTAYGFLNLDRAKEFTFETNADGTPIVVSWKSQTLNFGTNGSYGSIGCISSEETRNRFLSYNSGITADKEVTDDATYQALKNDEDWFTLNLAYCRYNHDSAVNTINSLPDTSAYLATQSGAVNTIKFRGEAGSLTDSGAINTLTEEEIAVATAKGWTVSLV